MVVPHSTIVNSEYGTEIFIGTALVSESLVGLNSEMKSQTIRNLQTLLRRSSSLLPSSSSSPKPLFHYKPVNLINLFLKPSILPHKLPFLSPQLNISPFYAQSLCCFSTSKYSEDSDECKQLFFTYAFFLMVMVFVAFVCLWLFWV